MDLHKENTIHRLISISQSRKSDLRRGHLLLSLSTDSIIAVNERLSEIRLASSLLLGNRGHRSTTSDAAHSPAERYARAHGTCVVPEYAAPISLYDVVTQVGGLIIEGTPGVVNIVDVSAFKHLAKLELRNLNVAQWAGLHWLRRRLRHLAITHAVPTLDHFILGDMPANLRAAVAGADGADLQALRAHLDDVGGLEGLQLQHEAQRESALLRRAASDDRVEDAVDSAMLALLVEAVAEWCFSLLSSLSVARNSLSVIDASLCLCPNLRHLDLSQNSISSLTPLVCCPNLTTLSLSFNQVATLEGLGAACPRLTVLSARSNRLTSLTGIEDLTSLTRLDVRDNFITDIEGLRPLRTLTRLNNLKLAGNPVSAADGARSVVAAVLGRTARGGVLGYVMDAIGAGGQGVIVDGEELTTRECAMANNVIATLPATFFAPPASTTTAAAAAAAAAAGTAGTAGTNVTDVQATATDTQMVEGVTVLGDVDNGRARFLRMIDAGGVDWDATPLPAQSTADSPSNNTSNNLFNDTLGTAGLDPAPSSWLPAATLATAPDHTLAGSVLANPGSLLAAAAAGAGAGIGGLGGMSFQASYPVSVFDIPDDAGVVELPTGANWLTELVEATAATTVPNAQSMFLAADDEDEDVAAMFAHSMIGRDNSLMDGGADTANIGRSLRPEAFAELLSEIISDVQTPVTSPTAATTANTASEAAADAAAAEYLAMTRDALIDCAVRETYLMETDTENLTALDVLFGIHTSIASARARVARLGAAVEAAPDDARTAAGRRLRTDLNIAENDLSRALRAREHHPPLHTILRQAATVRGRLLAIASPTQFTAYAHHVLVASRPADLRLLRVLVPVSGAMYLGDAHTGPDSAPQELVSRYLLVSATSRLMCEYDAARTGFTPTGDDRADAQQFAQLASTEGAAVRGIDLTQVVSVVPPSTRHFADPEAYKLLVVITADTTETRAVLAQAAHDIHATVDARIREAQSDTAGTGDIVVGNGQLEAIDDNEESKSNYSIGLIGAGGSVLASEMGLAPASNGWEDGPETEIHLKDGEIDIGAVAAEFAAGVVGAAAADVRAATGAAPAFRTAHDECAPALQHAMSVFSAAPVRTDSAAAAARAAADPLLRVAAAARVPPPASRRPASYMACVYLAATHALPHGESAAVDVVSEITSALRTMQSIPVSMSQPTWCQCLQCGSSFRLPASAPACCPACLTASSRATAARTARIIARHPLLPRDADPDRDADALALSRAASAATCVPAPALAAALATAQLPMPALWRFRAATRLSADGDAALQQPGHIITMARRAQAAATAAGDRRGRDLGDNFDPYLHSGVIANVLDMNRSLTSHYRLSVDARVQGAGAGRGAKSVFSTVSGGAELAAGDTVRGIWAVPFVRYAYRDCYPHRVLAVCTDTQFTIMQIPTSAAERSRIPVLFTRPLSSLLTIATTINDQSIILDFAGHRPFHFDVADPHVVSSMLDTVSECATIAGARIRTLDLTNEIREQLTSALGGARANETVTSFHIVLSSQRQRLEVLVTTGKTISLLEYQSNIFPAANKKYTLPAVPVFRPLLSVPTYNSLTLTPSTSSPALTLSWEGGNEWVIECYDLAHRARLVADLERFGKV